MKLETKRLILRSPKIEDAKDIFIALNNKNLSKYMMKIPYPYNIKMAKDYIDKCNEAIKRDKNKDYNFVIELKSEKKVIGSIGIKDVDDFKKIAGIGYWLNEDYWKQGIMSEAVFVILEFAFNKLKMRRINLICNEKNEASKAIAKKFGFKLEGIIRKAHVTLSTGKIADKYEYGLLREEWPKVKRRIK